MAVIDRDLVRAVNSGRCFALIGSGPSNQVGLPSWKKMAEIVVGELSRRGLNEAVEKSRSYLEKKKYPKVFSLAERVIGRGTLLDLLSQPVATSKERRGELYKLIAEWPFPCYLTTNFDDLLLEHLESAGNPFVVRRNSLDDMLLLRADARKLIFKIHGDFTEPSNIVLTEEEYRDFQDGPNRQYWREKINAVLHMVNLVILGYSASDPDFEDQLRRAKEVASQNNPVFMFGCNFDPQTVREVYKKYNIRVILYKDSDGTHSDLLRVLRRYHPFIARRGSSAVGLEPIDENVANLASSIHFFSQLRLAGSKDTCIKRTYESCILQILAGRPKGNKIKLDTIREELQKKTFASSHVDFYAMQIAIECLYEEGMISWSPTEQMLSLERQGWDTLGALKGERTLIREKFEKACSLFIKREYPKLNDREVTLIVKAIHSGLVRAYERRGMEIARSVFSDGFVNISDATDVLETINKAGAGLSTEDKKKAFADLMIEIMLKPDPEIKSYLAAISQGYFAYHALGLEPRCSEERLNMAKKRKWILDSSILLPILAVDSLNHLYARDLLRRMQNLKLMCFTTKRLSEEVRDHAWWAVTNFSGVDQYSPDLIQAATAGPGYKQNLFVDGYMKWSLDKPHPSFHEYLKMSFGPMYKRQIDDSIESAIRGLGIEIEEFPDRKGFSAGLWPERDEIAKEIEDLRRRFGTYKHEAQCIAEAEVVLIHTEEKAAFLSQSAILDRLKSVKSRLTWRPEAMYRFLSLFSTTPPGGDLLYQSMIQDFYYTGFDIVDNNVISEYVAPMIRQARMQLDEEKEKYEETLGKQKFSESREEFERIPDEQKPFYSMQFAFYVAEQERKKRKVAEAVAKGVESGRKLSEEERKEFDRLKRAKEEKRRKAERMRRKHASKAGRKKK
jgi:hypothetical protein